MKLSNENLRGFLNALPYYERLPDAARRALVEIERPTRSASALGGSLGVLIEEGFVLPPNAGGRAAVAPDRLDFLRVLRTLHANPVFLAPTLPAFVKYMETHLSGAERLALLQGDVGFGERNWTLHRRLTSPDWVEDFLEAKTPRWEAPYVKTDSPAMLSGVGVFELAQSLIRLLMDRKRPVAIHELPPFWPDSHLLSAAMGACIRYGLLFPALDLDTMDPIIGLWPSVASHTAQAAPVQPQTVSPTETFAPGFLVEDMTALMVACATEPLRLRANDDRLFAKTVRDLAETLHQLPKWVNSGFEYNAEMRVLTADYFVRWFELVEQQDLRNPKLALTARGRQWLGLSVSQRLRFLVDGLQNRQQVIPGFEEFEGTGVSAIVPQISVKTFSDTLQDLDEAVLKAFRSLPRNGFVPLSQFLAYRRSAANPLLATFKKDKNLVVFLGSDYLHRPDIDTLQKTWSTVLYEFLRIRLVPLGCAVLGTGQHGISISITPVGHYFLGQTEKWEWVEHGDAQILVQPNFDVTFLGEAPGAEAEIGRFAERRGRKIGALFQITKKSIYAAAAAGMSADNVLEILDRTCTREIPANVRREVSGWFAQCRKVSFESAMLIRCPDRDTAARVIGLAKGSATALTETVLEYKDPGKQRASLLKKLKDSGVLVDINETKEPKQKYAPMRRYRRRW